MLWSTKWPFLKWKLALRSGILGYKFSKYMPAVSSSVCCRSRPASFIYYQVPTLHFISPDRMSSGNTVMILTFEILFQFSKSPFIWTIKFILNNIEIGKYGKLIVLNISDATATWQSHWGESFVPSKSLSGSSDN